MSDFNYKLETEILPSIKDIKNLQILELGVQKGRSTKLFLEICKKNNGNLYSIDIDDCSAVSHDPNWKFIHSRDDDFEKIKQIIPKKLDVIFIDTIHEANHVRKLIYEYYKLLKKDGYIFIDDISHLPYLKDENNQNFYCEINNKETFDMILGIYRNNNKLFDLSFNFISSGLAIIKKKSDLNLNRFNKINSRENSFKNFLRKIWKKIKKD